MDPIKRLGRERKALKIRLTYFENLINEGKLDAGEMIHRYARLTKQIDGYEKSHQDCIYSGPEEEKFNDLDIFLDRYYAIGTKINARGTKIDESGTKINASETDADRTIDVPQIQVPQIDVPKFDGDINKWISYKNSFLTLIDSRTDITDIEKLLYLRDSLVGTPLKRLEMYDIIAENYKVSWNVLLDTYDQKRVILAQSFDALINTPKQENSSFEGLTRLLDNARARINIIDSFDMSAQALKVRLVERTLPDVIREEWDKRLNPDVYPTIEQLFEFLEETILIPGN
ncbi:uncharacterized protein LOC122521797 [Polistes fuscatus]|uniref:uncharacterized protein LOC122521797 n=1 Tax=Polistes fuscatus TaxID=30207 RepID=UPI001CA89FFC|nr:uncharacterized protein LOC122521797 [Polistes fuscatus]